MSNLFMIILILMWTAALIAVAVPARFWRNIFDHLTHGHYRDDKENLRILIDHLRSFPDEWSISRDAASFPKDGAKKVYLNFDNKKGWEYTLAAFDSKPRRLEGHYGSQLGNLLLEENNRREKESLLRNFYPNLDGPLMLGNSK